MTRRWQVFYRAAIGLCAAALASSAQASPPLSAETISAIGQALNACQGQIYRVQGHENIVIGPAELADRLSLLARPSEQLSFDEGRELYELSKGLLAPAIGKADWRMLDGKVSLTCPGSPKAGLALMEFLAGHMPDELRGPGNAIEWLALAYSRGAGGSPDPTRARQAHLRWQLHGGGWAPAAKWQDGIDQDFIAAAQRAGLREYVDALAQDPRNGAIVRMELAERVMASDPAKAARLLRSFDGRALNRLIQGEEKGTLPFLSDAQDVEFWAEASRSMASFERWDARLRKGVEQLNGGTIPTAAKGMTARQWQRYLDIDAVRDASGMLAPIATRALVNPQGKVLVVEACLPPGPETLLTAQQRLAALDAARAAGISKMEQMAALVPPTIAGKPAFGWVRLPGVKFTRDKAEKLTVELVDLPPSQCQRPAITAPPPMISAPPPPR